MCEVRSWQSCPHLGSGSDGGAHGKHFWGPGHVLLFDLVLVTWVCSLFTIRKLAKLSTCDSCHFLCRVMLNEKVYIKQLCCFACQVLRSRKENWG